MLYAGIVVVAFTFIGFSQISENLYAVASTAGGLEPPQWLTDYHWAKPALIIMGLWAANRRSGRGIVELAEAIQPNDHFARLGFFFSGTDSNTTVLNLYPTECGN